MKTIEIEKIYRKEHNNVLYFFMSRINNLQIAEELANDVFIKLLNALQTGRYNEDKSQLKTYLYNISKNLLIDFYRTKKKGMLHIENFVKDNEENNFSEVFIEEDKSMETKEFYMRVKKIYNTLSLREKRIFVLRFVRGYKYKEIAKKLDIKIDTIKVLITRLKKKLEPQMEYLRG